MFDQNPDLNDLAARAGQGENKAAEALRRALQPHLARIVRRTLRGPVAPSTLTRRILAEAGQATLIQRDQLASQVAGRLSESLTNRLRTLAPSAGMLETVVA
ncbi:MAG TPA: hypothetical protein VGZ25_14170 [Gemmataceae bacterium]|jgi:hypothetical protein|nr:hypothetical protein [Gemmataceae bacterium]